MTDSVTSTHETILIVEDDVSLRDALCDTLSMTDYTVLTADGGMAALDILAEQKVAMVISDVQMESMDGHTLLKKIKSRWESIPVILMTAYGTIQKAVESMRDGAVDYLVKPFEAEVLISMVSRYVGNASADNDNFIAVDQESKDIFETGARVADSDATLLITGESGSGKEVLARYIHRRSNRVDQPFVAINCAAIPDNMLEATLFGYEKGAFTGAYKACPGKFEQAQNGTLLLDEISEMALGLQAKLLRVLQEREVERLGGNRLISLDVRVIATTNRDMKEQVSEGKFREDLFYRLNVFPVHMLPLHERPDDIIPLTEMFIRRIAVSSGRAIPQLSSKARSKLVSYGWPGNVRELDNVVQRAMILQRGDIIDESDLQFEMVTQSSRNKTADKKNIASERKTDEGGSKLGDDLKNHEQEKIITVLKNSMGNRSVAASRLGISQRTLRYKLARLREAGIAIPGSIGGGGGN